MIALMIVFEQSGQGRRDMSVTMVDGGKGEGRLVEIHRQSNQLRSDYSILNVKSNVFENRKAA